MAFLAERIPRFNQSLRMRNIQRNDIKNANRQMFDLLLIQRISLFCEHFPSSDGFR
jgi:hypothetical protein